MRRIALIPARGGSKRLPRKNIADFQGKPIIARTIQAARDSGLFADIVVSTEDNEIAAVAQQYGARVDRRADHLAGDSARVLDVCLDFLDRNECDILAVLYATAPLRGAADIRATMDFLDPGICDFSFAATEFSLPPHQAMLADASGFVHPMWPDLVNKRSSEVGRLLVDNGSTYCVAVDAFRTEKTFFGARTRAHVMPRERSQDIDEPLDLELARFFAARQAAS